MTWLLQYLFDPHFVVMVLAAVAAFATITSFVLPLLSGDRLNSRMRYVAGERKRLRAENMVRLAEGQYRGKLKTEPKTFMKRVVKQLNLRKALETEETRERLKMAGLRGQAPVVAFLFFRAVLPVATFGLTFFYLVFLNSYHLAPLLNLGLSIIGALCRVLSAEHLCLQPHRAPPEVHQARFSRLSRLAPHLRSGWHVGRVGDEQGGQRDRFPLARACRGVQPHHRGAVLSSGATPSVRKSWKTHGNPGGAGGWDEPDPSRALRYRDWPGA